jgi:hypothetical protein
MFLAASALFFLNNLVVVSGWLDPPPGYSAVLLPHSMDMAQYETAATAYQTRSLIPSYQAPWLTDAALFMPILWALARVCSFLSIRFVTGYHLLHLMFYVAAAFSLLLAVRVFTRTRRQAIGAFLILVCSIPVKSLAVLPAWVAGGGDLKGRPGLVDFAWWSSDGFAHGISGSAMVTFARRSQYWLFPYWRYMLRQAADAF